MMTKEQKEQRLKVAKAWIEGKTIQFKPQSEKKYITFSGECPGVFDEETEWRVKLTPRVIYVNEYDSGILADRHYPDEFMAKSARGIYKGKAIKFVEVVDD